MFSRSFSVPCAQLSMPGGFSRTGYDGIYFPVHRGRNGRDVSMAAMCDCVKECVSFISNDHLICWLIVYNVYISHNCLVGFRLEPFGKRLPSQLVLQGPPRIVNGAHGTKHFLLNTRVSENFAY